MDEKEFFAEYEELTVEKELSYKHEAQNLMAQKISSPVDLQPAVDNRRRIYIQGNVGSFGRYFGYKHNHKSHPIT